MNKFNYFTYIYILINIKINIFILQILVIYEVYITIYNNKFNIYKFNLSLNAHPGVNLAFPPVGLQRIVY